MADFYKIADDISVVPNSEFSKIVSGDMGAANRNAIGIHIASKINVELNSLGSKSRLLSDDLQKRIHSLPEEIQGKLALALMPSALDRFPQSDQLKNFSERAEKLVTSAEKLKDEPDNKAGNRLNETFEHRVSLLREKQAEAAFKKRAEKLEGPSELAGEFKASPSNVPPRTEDKEMPVSRR